MKPIALAVFALLLSACPRPPITSEHRDVFAAALDGWHRAGLPNPGSCLNGARVETHDGVGDFRDRCRLNDSHGKVAGCLARYQRGMFGQRDGVLVVVAPGYERDYGLVVHESMHALVECTGLSEFPDLFDAGHRNPKVWKDVGGEQSAQWLSGVF